MGNGITISSIFPDTNFSDLKALRKNPYTPIFEEACPYFMSIGVSYDDYWNGEPEICKYARKAEEYRQREKNQYAWLSSIYIFRALLDASPAFHDFGDGQQLDIHYSVERPFPMSQKEAEEIERERQQKYIETFRERMKAAQDTINHQLLEKEKKQKQQEKKQEEA